MYVPSLSLIIFFAWFCSGKARARPLQIRLCTLSTACERDLQPHCVRNNQKLSRNVSSCCQHSGPSPCPHPPLNGSRLGAPSPGWNPSLFLRAPRVLQFGHRVEALPTLSGQLVSEFVVVTASPGALPGSAVRVRGTGAPSAGEAGVRWTLGRSATPPLAPLWAVKDVDSLPNRLKSWSRFKHHQRSSRYRRMNGSYFGIHLTIHLMFGRG